MTEKIQRENLSMSKLTEGRFLSSAEVASRLGVNESSLRTLVYEKQHGGRTVKSGDDEFDVPASARANLLPEPTGVVAKSLVWGAAEIEAIAAEFQALKASRGRKPKAD